MLKCTRCKQEKPENSEFFPLHNKKANGLDSWCRQCRGTYRSEIRRGKYREMIPDHVLKDVLNKTFECTICGEETDLVVDHDHKRNVVRGLLCNKCNKGLGLFRDNPDYLEFARIYLLSSEGSPEADEYIREHGQLNLYGEQGNV